MLHRRADTLRLQSFDERGTERPGYKWVLGEVLEVSSAQWRALDVDTRTKHDCHPLRTRLPTHSLTDGAHQLHIPGRAQRRGRREACRWRATADTAVVAGVRLHPQAMRAIAQPHRRNAQPFDATGVPEVRTQTQ